MPLPTVRLTTLDFYITICALMLMLVRFLYLGQSQIAPSTTSDHQTRNTIAITNTVWPPHSSPREYVPQSSRVCPPSPTIQDMDNQSSLFVVLSLLFRQAVNVFAMANVQRCLLGWAEDSPVSERYCCWLVMGAAAWDAFVCLCMFLWVEMES